VTRFRPSSKPRAELLARLTTAGRELSAAAVMFHTAVAATRGLTATETKAVDVLDRTGPLTAGELAARTGLAPPSITGLVNRLERKGFVRRLDDPADRRRVRIERTPESLLALAPLFADFANRLSALYETFTDEQLETILHFMHEVARHQHAATTTLVATQVPSGSSMRA
jgi:DNA-binding MarR family transcriptional regulator